MILAALSDTSMAHYLGVRIGRKYWRSFAGPVLDMFAPLPDSFVRRVQNWSKPRAYKVEKGVMLYPTFFQGIHDRRHGILKDYAKRTLLYGHLASVLSPLANGDLWTGASRVALLGYTSYKVGKRGYESYQSSHQLPMAFRQAAAEAGKWIIGAEISSLSHDIGYTMSKKRGSTTGMLLSILCSALFDKNWDLLTNGQSGSRAIPALPLLTRQDLFRFQRV